MPDDKNGGFTGGSNDQVMMIKPIRAILNARICIPFPLIQDLQEETL